MAERNVLHKENRENRETMMKRLADDATMRKEPGWKAQVTLTGPGPSHRPLTLTPTLTLNLTGPGPSPDPDPDPDRLGAQVTLSLTPTLIRP